MCAGTAAVSGVKDLGITHYSLFGLVAVAKASADTFGGQGKPGSLEEGPSASSSRGGLRNIGVEELGRPLDPLAQTRGRGDGC